MPNCRHCQEPIKFAKLAGRSIPVNVDPAIDGRLVLFHAELGGVLTARPARLPDDQLRPRHHDHRDTRSKRPGA